MSAVEMSALYMKRKKWHIAGNDTKKTWINLKKKTTHAQKQHLFHENMAGNLR